MQGTANSPASMTKIILSFFLIVVNLKILQLSHHLQVYLSHFIKYDVDFSRHIWFIYAKYTIMAMKRGDILRKFDYKKLMNLSLPVDTI